MNISLGKHADGTMIALQGRFVFETHREFRRVVAKTLEESASLHLDLGGVDYLDSAGLGMLLMLNDKAKALGKKVSLRNSRGSVKDILDITGVTLQFAA
jgi:anti-anti-sigma factor